MTITKDKSKVHRHKMKWAKEVTDDIQKRQVSDDRDPKGLRKFKTVEKVMSPAKRQVRTCEDARCPMKENVAVCKAGVACDDCQDHKCKCYHHAIGAKQAAHRMARTRARFESNQATKRDRKKINTAGKAPKPPKEVKADDDTQVIEKVEGE